MATSDSHLKVREPAFVVIPIVAGRLSGSKECWSSCTDGPFAAGKWFFQLDRRSLVEMYSKGT